MAIVLDAQQTLERCMPEMYRKQLAPLEVEMLKDVHELGMKSTEVIEEHAAKKATKAHTTPALRHAHTSAR